MEPIPPLVRPRLHAPRAWESDVVRLASQPLGKVPTFVLDNDRYWRSNRHTINPKRRDARYWTLIRDNLYRHPDLQLKFGVYEGEKHAIELLQSSWLLDQPVSMLEVMALEYVFHEEIGNGHKGVFLGDIAYLLSIDRPAFVADMVKMREMRYSWRYVYRMITEEGSARETFSNWMQHPVSKSILDYLKRNRNRKATPFAQLARNEHEADPYYDVLLWRWCSIYPVSAVYTKDVVGSGREVYESIVTPARQTGYAALAPYWERGIYNTAQINAAIDDGVAPDLLDSILNA